MNCLAVNTAGPISEVVLIRGDEYFVSRIAEKTATSTSLLPTIDALIKGKLALSDTDCFGVCIGPGSFTGIRIGVATVKAFCYALGVPAVTVTLNRAVAYNNLGGSGALSFVDAGNGYCDYGVCDASGAEIVKPTLARVQEIPSIIAAHTDKQICCDRVIGGKASLPIAEGDGFYKAVLAELKAENFIGGDAVEPLYVRKPQAEVEYENKRRNRN